MLKLHVTFWKDTAGERVKSEGENTKEINKEVPDKGTGKKGSAATVVLFAVSLIVVAVIAITEFAGKKDRSLAGDVNCLFLIPAAGCFLIALSCETLKYFLMLKESGMRHPARLAFRVGVIGKYYDNITPAGAGGQPFQMYELKRNGVSGGTAGSLPIVGFLGLQFAFVFVGIITMICERNALTDDLLAIKIIASVGMVFYAFIPICVVIFAFAPGALEAIAGGITKLLGRLRVLKHAPDLAEKQVRVLRSYSESLRAFGKNITLMAVIFGISVVYQVAVLSMPFFVLHMFGSSIGFSVCFCRVVFIYAAITVIFTPGNSGAAEASFYLVFSGLTGGGAFWGMLVWRVLCYYSWIILGAVVQLRDNYLRKLSEKWHRLPKEEGSAALFVDRYFPELDGVVSCVHAYAENIPGCYVVCPEKKGGRVPARSYGVARVRGFAMRHFKVFCPTPCFSKEAKRYIRTHAASVFHAHSPFPVGRMAEKYGRRLKVPVIATFHSKYYEDFIAATHSELISKILLKGFIVPFYERADKVWACSAQTAETLKGYGYRGEIEVMDNGTDMIMPANAERLRNQIREELDIPEDGRGLLFVGQLVWHKNIRLILDTVETLKERGRNVKMIFVGDGGDLDEVMAYSRERELDSEVLFMGRIGNRIRLRNIYLACDLFFFPSEYDNAPITVREAAALGLCSLLLKGSNAAECVKDGDNGFLCEAEAGAMADKIEYIFEGNLEKAAGERAKETIPVPWKEICARVRKKYKNVAETAGIN